MLLQQITCLLTLIFYLPTVSSPACSSQLYSIVCVSKDLYECVSPVQDCEVCAPFPISTSSCESKKTSIITLIILLCLIIELFTHPYQLPADSTNSNKTRLLYSNHLSESASLTIISIRYNLFIISISTKAYVCFFSYRSMWCLQRAKRSCSHNY